MPRQLPVLAGRAFILLVGVAGVMHAPEPVGNSIEATLRQAEDLAHYEAFGPARVALQIALRAAERRGENALVARCLDGIGSVLDFEGRTAEAAPYHQRALGLSQRLGNPRLEASILASLGRGHWRRSEYDAALDALHAARRVQGPLNDDPGLARTLLFIGGVHFKRAEYGKARDSYNSAIAILDRINEPRLRSRLREALGDLALEQGFFVESLRHYDEVLAAHRHSGDRAGEVYALHLVGRAYLVQGAFREALAWFDQAVRVSRDNGNVAGLALALYHAAIAHGGLAERDEALDLYAQALALKEKLGDRRQQAWILARMGDVHSSGGDLSAALERYREATRLWMDVDDPRGVATGLEKTARVELVLGRYTEALASFRRAADVLIESQPAFLASAVAGLGETYAAAGMSARAREQAVRAVELSRRGGNDTVRWAAARSLGRVERRLGRDKEALAAYRESLDIIEALRGRVISSADVRAGFLEGKQGVYSETLELLLDDGRVGEALEVAERARGRAFLDLLSARHLETSIPHRRTDREPVASAPLHAAAPVNAITMTLAEIRREARRRNTTILEYFSSSDRLHMWVVTPDGRVHTRTSPISRSSLTDLVSALRRELSAGPRRTLRSQLRSSAGHQAFSEARQRLRQLHDLLIGPVSELLPSSRDQLVTIVPHGPLFLVSFATLIDARGSYLVERHTIGYSPSVSVLRYTSQRRGHAVAGTSPRMMLVGNPTMPDAADGAGQLEKLPGAELEIRAIGALYPSSQVTSLVQSTAGERLVRKLAPSHTIVHLATHAVVFDTEPMNSYVALTPDRGLENSHYDGRLTVAEVLGLELDADLVTLSACNTGLGHVSGDGIAGFSRAFIYAGASSVLVSLWRVADPVAAFQMERFYRRLIQTKGNKAAALAAAQRETIVELREGGIRTPSGEALAENPVLWAPFVLVGEPD